MGDNNLYELTNKNMQGIHVNHVFHYLLLS